MIGTFNGENVRKVPRIKQKTKTIEKSSDENDSVNIIAYGHG